MKTVTETIICESTIQLSLQETQLSSASSSPLHFNDLIPLRAVVKAMAARLRVVVFDFCPKRLRVRTVKKWNRVLDA